MFILQQIQLGYENVAVRLNGGPAKWTDIWTDNCNGIETFLAHYKVFARETNYVTNFF